MAGISIVVVSVIPFVTFFVAAAARGWSVRSLLRCGVDAETLQGPRIANPAETARVLSVNLYNVRRSGEIPG
jgi:uncharacterized membrane protein YcfT